MITSGNEKVEFRWMDRRDLFDVLSIERSSFSDPWTEKEFINVLGKRDCVGHIAEILYGNRKQTVGFVVYYLAKTEIEIASVAVAVEFRRRGFGRQIVEWIKSKLSHDRRPRMFSIVRESNLAAHLFFKSCGLRAVKVEKAPFSNNEEDGYKFVYRLPIGAPFERPPHHLRASE